MASHCDLAEGTFVRVTPTDGSAPHVAKVVGYDMGRSKYHLGVRFAGWGRWLFTTGGSWAFPGEVEEITEEEATRVGLAANAPEES